MSVKVRIPTPLMIFTNNQANVEAQGANINKLIENLEASYAGIKERLTDGNGEVRRFVNIYVNGEDIRFLDGLETALKDGDSVSIVPAVAGG